MIEVQCENIHLRMEGNTLYCRKGDSGWQQIEVETLQPLGKSYWGAGHILCIRDFYSAIEENRPFSLELSGVEETARLMLMIYASARQQHTVNWEDSL